MTLSISDFASISQLSTQTLRHYDSEGILTPAAVDPVTGYRHYTFDQIHRAVTISTLRAASMSIASIRDVLDSPDSLPAVLQNHEDQLVRLRTREDAAIRQARDLVDGWPNSRDHVAAAANVVRTRVAGTPVDLEGRVIPSTVAAELEHISTQLTLAGIPPIGAPWCSYALDSSDDKAKVLTAAGPDWFCFVPVADADGVNSLPEGVHYALWEERAEIVVALTAAPTTNVLAAVLDHVLKAALQRELVPHLAQPRYVLHPDGYEVAIAVEQG